MTPEEALDKVIAHPNICSMQILANNLRITKGAVGQWKLVGRKIPAKHCPIIERLVSRAVTCEQLRPDVDWEYLRASTKSDAA